MTRNTPDVYLLTNDCIDHSLYEQVPENLKCDLNNAQKGHIQARLERITEALRTTLGTPIKLHNLSNNVAYRTVMRY